MMLQEEKMVFAEIQKNFETAHAELKAKIEAAQKKRDFKQVIVLLNEERELVKQNSEKMLAVMAASK